MLVATERTELPFVPVEAHEGSCPTYAEARDWFLALRHAQIRFHPEDRLLLLHGHPLVFRLGLYAAGERVLAGQPIVYLDGAHTFDPFFIGRMARAHRRQPRALLSMIHVARAFSCHQLERLITNCLMSALERYQSRLAIVSGLFDTFYDQAVPEHEALRLFGRVMDASQKLTQHGFTMLFLCPQAPMLTRGSRRCLDQMRGQADRVIRVEEAQGVVSLHDEGEQAGTQWEFPRTVLDLS
ncbi:MAG TPA: hypothetical protein VFM24_03135 [Nitrospira sp.]|nr:hypothetical protein [Nitrospira sp.]